MQHGPGAAASPGAGLRPGRWVLVFLSIQIVCQLMLLVEQLSPLRVIIRTAGFAASLVLLAVLPRRGPRHPSAKAIGFVLAILGVSLFHPTTNSFVAGIGHIALYVAIAAPLFWVPSLAVDARVLRNFFLLLWLFHTVGSLVGVLQVYFPGQFQPALSTVILNKGEGYVQSLQITLADGQQIFRPMGLTDAPGGAAGAGFFAVLLGVAFFLTSRKLSLRAAALGSIVLGAFCVYVSHVRVMLVLMVVCLIALAIMLAIRGQATMVLRLAGVVGACAVLSLMLALSVGGESVQRRLSTLIERDAGDVYYSNRGFFLEHTLEELLPEYPVGAGIARWGMVNVYFGDKTDPERASIHVEIQLTGWVLDGGVPLVLAYAIAMLTALWVAFRIALGRRAPGDSLGLWGSMLFAYNIGILAQTFSYPVFAGQVGLEFWLINALVFAAAVHSRPASPPAPVPARLSRPLPRPRGLTR